MPQHTCIAHGVTSFACCHKGSRTPPETSNVKLPLQKVLSCLQWFGDLVTCDYWGELWLNEGFATYFENYGATAARPEFRFYDTFYADQSSYGQLVDAKNVSTHALATITGMPRLSLR